MIKVEIMIKWTFSKKNQLGPNQKEFLSKIQEKTNIWMKK